MSSPEPRLRPVLSPAPHPSNVSPPPPPVLSPGAYCCPGQSWPSLCARQAPPPLTPSPLLPTVGYAFRSFVYNAGDRTSPHGLKRVVFFYFILLFLLIFNLNLLTCTPPQLRVNPHGQSHGPGCSPCPTWGVASRTHPSPPRTPQPQSQASPLAWPSGPLGYHPGGCHLPLSRNRINVCMNFRFHSVWCFGGHTGP